MIQYNKIKFLWLQSCKATLCSSYTMLGGTDKSINMSSNQSWENFFVQVGEVTSITTGMN